MICGRYLAIGFWSFLCSVIVVLGLLFFSACRTQSDDAAYETAFRNAEQLQKAGDKERAVAYLDSFFKSRSQVNPEYLFDKYKFLKNYYYYSSAYDKSTLYVDSMLYALRRYPRQKNYASKYTETMNDRGDRYYTQNNLGAAFESYYKSRLSAMSIGDSCNMGNHSYHLGMVCYRQEKYADAISFFKQSFRENENCGADSINFFRSQELLNNIGLCYTRMGYRDSAMHYYTEALRFMDTHGHKYGDYTREFIQRARGVIYGNQAKVFTLQKRYDTAEALLRRSIAINQRAGYDSIDVQYAHMQLAELYELQGKSPDTLVRELEALLQRIPNQDVQLRWFLLRSRTEESRGAPGASLQYLRSYISLKDSLESVNTFRQTNISQLLEYQEAQAKMKLLARDNELRKLYLVVAAVFAGMILLIAGLIYNNYQKSRANVKVLTALNAQVREKNEHLSFTLSALERSITEKNRIMKVVAHDLRGPVSGVAFLTDRMLRNSDLPSDDRKSLSIIRDTSLNSMNLINELLEKQQASQMEDASVVDFGKQASEVLEILEHSIEGKGLRLETYGLDQQANVYINPGKLARVLTNIISNAIKFSSDGGEIQILLKIEDSWATLEIRDYGIGIPEDKQSFLFSAVDAVQREGTHGEKSFGLGLSVVRQIMISYNGKIWFESREGQGTVFYLSLQLASAIR
ncbi:MAG: sensor histidine kinase [Sphingobacteriales bacterium]|nr:MAG: sensor histidine kinase [Sphingobacteriales bacterium]